MIRSLIIAIGLLLLITGCDSKPAADIDYGTINNNVYSNKYFDISINLPDTWFVQSQAAQKALMETGSNLIAGDDKTLKSVMKESEKQTVNLFSIFKYESGAPVNFNPSIISVAERISHMPGIKRGSDYLFHARKLLESGQMNYDFPNDLYTKEVSELSFDVMPAQITVNNITVYQDYHVVKIKDYALALILSYSSDSEKSELDGILNELKFSK
tara:strand:- start:172 stop:813 length:642 start_codon:yes stop_codon:yes gene_type:complete